MEFRTERFKQKSKSLNKVDEKLIGVIFYLFLCFHATLFERVLSHHCILPSTQVAQALRVLLLTYNVSK